MRRRKRTVLLRRWDTSQCRRTQVHSIANNEDCLIDDAPWPATKEELIDYAIRSCAPLEVVENLSELDDDDEIYETIEDIWPDYPSKEDFLWNEEEY